MRETGSTKGGERERDTIEVKPLIEDCGMRKSGFSDAAQETMC